MENIISINDFMNKYNQLNSSKDKEQLLLSIVKKDVRTSYATKVVTADQIFQQSHFDKNGNIIFNSSKEFVLKFFSLLMFYTNLAISNNSFEDFDNLNQSLIIDDLISLIRRKNLKDYQDFNSVFEMRKQDFIQNYGVKRINTNDITDAIKKGILEGINIILDQLVDLSKDESIQKYLQDAMNQISNNNN